MAFGDVLLLLSGPTARSGADMPTSGVLSNVTQAMLPLSRFSCSYGISVGALPQGISVVGIHAAHTLSGGWARDVALGWYSDGSSYSLRIDGQVIHSGTVGSLSGIIKHVYVARALSSPTVFVGFWVRIDGGVAPLNAGGEIATTYSLYDGRNATDRATSMCTGAVSSLVPQVGSPPWCITRFPYGGFDFIAGYSNNAYFRITFAVVGTTYIEATIYYGESISSYQVIVQQVPLTTGFVGYVFIGPASRICGAVFYIDVSKVLEAIGYTVAVAPSSSLLFVSAGDLYAPPIYTSYYGSGMLRFVYYLYNTKNYPVTVTVSPYAGLGGSVLTGYGASGDDSDSWWFFTSTTIDPANTAGLSETAYVLLDYQNATPKVFELPANSYCKVRHTIRIGASSPTVGTSGLSGFTLT